MRSKILLCCTLSGALMLSGCQYAVQKNIQVAQPNAKFSSVTAKCSKGEMSQLLEKKIMERLSDENIAIGDDLLIDCNFIDYDQGSRALRYFVGFGTGAGSAKAKVYLVDKYNKDVAVFEVDSAISIGLFGGDHEIMISQTAKKIVSYVKNYYTTNK